MRSSRREAGAGAALIVIAAGVFMTCVIAFPLAVAGAVAGLSSAGSSRVTTQLAAATASCDGSDLRQFGNGRIPRSALCRVWGAEGHRLRDDAAEAFEALSRRFSDEFGRPLCVTDSYRTYAEQVRLRASKPSLAAVPGTSNHGWGTAVDLCGGVEQFGTRVHQWMRANAARYGWVLPPWARRTGSKPEPWHWEYQP